MASSLPAPAWVFVGILGGFLAGGVAPRADLASCDKDLARLQDDLIKAQRQAARRSPLSMVGLDRAGTPPLVDRQPTPDKPSAPPSLGVEQTVAPADEDSGGPSMDAPGTDDQGMDSLEQFELAVDAQRLRIDQSRAALAEQADMDDAQLAALDATTAEMNERLSALGDDLLTMMNSAGDPDSRELLGLTHDVSGILYDAQLDLDEIIGPDAVASVEPDAREVWNYIDMESFRGAVESAAAGSGSTQ